MVSRLDELGITSVDGILLDLGVSSHQIDEAERGFSFLHNGPLDMRMDNSQKLSAYEVVNTYPREKLLKILYQYGEESNAKNIVNKIVDARKIKHIQTTEELKDIVESAFPKKIIFGKGGVCKKTFQAIRIEVNQELEGLEDSIKEMVDKLSTKGRICIISFHSLEDRIVKDAFKDAVTGCICPPKTPICICGHKPKGVLVNRKPIVSSEEEIKNNSRCTSAKLRVLEKL
jgi:16S rRNA (cytosine1402-N4)-methyltransferase